MVPISLMLALVLGFTGESERGIEVLPGIPELTNFATAKPTHSQGMGHGQTLPKRPSFELKTRPKQILGSLLKVSRSKPCANLVTVLSLSLSLCLSLPSVSK